MDVREKRPVYDDVYFPVFKANIYALHLVYLHILERPFKNFNLESSAKNTLHFLRPVTLVSGNYGTTILYNGMFKIAPPSLHRRWGFLTRL